MDLPRIGDKSTATNLYRLGAGIAQVVPSNFAAELGSGLGTLWSTRTNEQRRMVLLHQQRAAGGTLSPRQLDAAARETFASYGRYWADTLRLPTVSSDEVARRFTADGIEHLDAAVAGEVGPILALPHLGSWEWAAAWLTRVKHYKVAAVVEQLEPPDLFEWFRELRESLGMNIIPLGAQAGPSVIRALNNREIVCLLSDRDIAGGGVEVEFFGERTTLPAGPATLSIRTGAPLIPTAVYERPGNRLGMGRAIHAVVEAPIDTTRTGRLRADVARITQELAYRLEALIRAEPTQWHLMSPNWPSDRQQ